MVGIWHYAALRRCSRINKSGFEHVPVAGFSSCTSEPVRRKLQEGNFAKVETCAELDTCVSSCKVVCWCLSVLVFFICRCFVDHVQAAQEGPAACPKSLQQWQRGAPLNVQASCFVWRRKNLDARRAPEGPNETRQATSTPNLRSSWHFTIGCEGVVGNRG